MRKGHSFRPLIKRVSRSLFDLMAKYAIKAVNDITHSNKRKSVSSDKQSNSKHSSDR